jgi:hypothetical protein
VTTLFGVVYLTGCVTPTSLSVDRKITKDGNILEHTVVTATAIPHDVKDLLLQWSDVVTFKVGNAKVITTDYEAIANGVAKVLCTRDPTCKNEGDSK